MNCNAFQLKLHEKKRSHMCKIARKKTISRVQNCTEKKRSRVCKIAREKSDFACAHSPVPIAIWNISDYNMFSKNNSVNN